MSVAVPFPSVLPEGYQWFDDEPAFDPARHLALGRPQRVYTLMEFGYPEDEVAMLPTDVAASSPYRVLSDTGAQIMLDVARRLRTEAISCERIENMTRGGVYQSRWLRDLCLDPSLAELMSDIYGTAVAPHPMPAHLGHLNYEPDHVDQAVDKWHHDTLPLDFVMGVTDLSRTNGGEFEFFVGTKAEAAQLAAKGQRPPIERVRAAALAPGHAVALHGNMVVHRGAPLAEPAERITMVNGYVALDTTPPDQSRTEDLIPIDDHRFLYSDWTRHVAWRSGDRLRRLVEEAPQGLSPAGAIEALEHAVEDVQAAIAAMRSGAPEHIHHYEHPVTDGDTTTTQ